MSAVVAVERVEARESWLRRWLFTTNHKDIGILYILTSLYFGVVGAVLALLMRVQLALPLNTFLTPAAYNQAVTMHGLIMILWFLSPFAIGFANYFVPLQIGAEDLALPRLNALSYWMYLFGGILASLGFFLPGGDANGGWTTYVPLATSQYSPGPGPTMAFAGLVMLVTSVTLGSINILLTVAWMRAPGVTWRKVPAFTWFVVFTVLQMLFSFPSLLAGLLILMSDRVLGTFFFVSSSGGTILWDNLFWFFGHPEVYVVLLPAFGLVAEILPVFAGRPLADKNIILIATGAVVVPLSYLVWQHHMFVTGVNLSEDEAFSITTILISLPFDVITLSFVKTLTKASIRLTVPMLFAIGSIILFIIGGITGVFLSSFVLDTVYHGTYFVVGHFHYVMVGAAIFGLFAGMYYYLPKMTGRMYHETMAKTHFIISMIGFNVLYFPFFFLYDMPRRIYTYQNIPSWDMLNLIATVGAFIFAFAQILFAANLAYTVKRGAPSPPNPWGASTLEWIPNVIGGSTSHVSGAAIHGSGVHQEHLSARPITLALGLMIALMGIGLMGYSWGLPIALVGFVILGYNFVRWARDDLQERFTVPEEAEGERWPFSGIPKLKLGMWIFLSSEVIIFGAILASYLFIRFSSPNWPVPGSIHEVPVGLANTIVLLTSGLTAVFALQSVREGDRKGLIKWLAVTLVLGAVFMGIKGSEWYGLLVLHNPPFTWASGLPGSAYFFIVGIHGAHVTAGLVVMIYLLKKAMAGGYDKDHHIGVENFVMYWAFVDIIWLFIFPLFYLV